MTTDLPDYVTKAEVDAACSSLERASGWASTAFQKRHALRVRAFLRFLWLTGCRVSEALAVRPGDLDGHLALVLLVTLKRRTPTSRTMPLPAAFMAELGALVQAGDGKRVFPWSRSRAFELVRDALVAAGVSRDRAHPHALRHGHAIHAIQNQVSLDALQRVLGHSAATTTSLYLRATAEDVRRAYDKIDW